MYIDGGEYEERGLASRILVVIQDMKGWHEHARCGASVPILLETFFLKYVAETEQRRRTVVDFSSRSSRSETILAFIK
jgi:hypothetical protein